MKGRAFQRDVKRWLANVRLFGAKTRILGDAYDVTSSAAVLGEKQFDLSLAMLDGNDTNRSTGVVYVECKFIGDPSASSGSKFQVFLKDVLEACRGSQREAREAARFLFVTTFPPGRWEAFLRDGVSELRAATPPGFKQLKDGELALIASRIAILVVTSALLGGTY
jgi:hypothetical protein